MLTTLGAPQGQTTVEAARLATHGVNQAGGLLVGDRRHKVELVIEDSGNTPSEAVEAARRLLHQEQVLALVGPSFSRDAIAVADVAENARVPMISPGSSHPQTTRGKRYVFRICSVDPLQASVMARFATQELEAKTAAVLYDVADIFTRTTSEGFRDAFTEAGGRIVGFETYTSGATDWRASLERLAVARPDVLFLPNYYRDAIGQARQARSFGMEATFLGVDGWLPSTVEDIPALEGSLFTQHWHPDLSERLEASRRFIDAHLELFGRRPLSRAGLSYDAFGVLFEALRLAGEPEPEKVRDVLASLTGYPGATGEITFRGHGGDPAKQLVILRIENGRVILHKIVLPEPSAAENPAR